MEKPGILNSCFSPFIPHFWNKRGLNPLSYKIVDPTPAASDQACNSRNKLRAPAQTKKLAQRSKATSKRCALSPFKYAAWESHYLRTIPPPILPSTFDPASLLSPTLISSSLAEKVRTECSPLPRGGRLQCSRASRIEQGARAAGCRRRRRAARTIHSVKMTN